MTSRPAPVGAESDESARTFRGAWQALKGAQKTSKGAPAYSRFVNRPLGRALAAAAFVLGRTPNQITVLSALCTYSALAVIALVEPVWWASVLVLLGLTLGYALDAADGQLARLRGGGSPQGEWLDHIVDAGKLGALHLCVAVSWFRFEDRSTSWLLVPLGFQAVATVQFFAILLMDQLRRAHRGTTRAIMSGDGTSTTLYSLAIVPIDYGTMCVVLGTMAASTFFLTTYSFLFVCGVLFLAASLPKWYREVGALARADVPRPDAE